MPKEEKSYYDYVTDIEKNLDMIYDQVGWLRDAAYHNEKQIYNDTRGTLRTLVSKWRQFRDQLPEDRADMTF
jgi:hypothetical protein